MLKKYNKKVYEEKKESTQHMWHGGVALIEMALNFFLGSVISGNIGWALLGLFLLEELPARFTSPCYSRNLSETVLDLVMLSGFTILITYVCRTPVILFLYILEMMVHVWIIIRFYNKRNK